MFRYLECVKANYPDLYRQLQIIKMSHDPINFCCAAHSKLSNFFHVYSQFHILDVVEV